MSVRTAGSYTAYRIGTRIAYTSVFLLFLSVLWGAIPTEQGVSIALAGAAVGLGVSGYALLAEAREDDDGLLTDYL